MMEPESQTKPQSAATGLSDRIDIVLGRIYNYHGEAKPPKSDKDTWGVPARLPEGTKGTVEYFLHYFQSQGLGPTTNECVTTSAVMAMNMMEDRLRAEKESPVCFEANTLIEVFIRNLDALGIRGWRYRFSTRSPFPGMMPPWGARRALRDHASRLKQAYGRSYRVETRIHQSVDDLIRALEEGKIILLHGAWQKKLSDPVDRNLALLGGMPHTMVLVGYQHKEGFWNLLNPAEPWLVSRNTEYHPHLFRMTTEQLMDFWGRRFIFYPPRFAVTLLTEEP